MMRNLLLLMVFSFAAIVLHAQTALEGKITDADTGEPLFFANILVTKNGVTIIGTTADIDGNFSVTPIDPGTYDVEISYTGYQSQKQEGVVVLPSKVNKLNAALSTGGGVILDDVVIVDYQAPLVEVDNTTQGQTITSEQIRNLPTRNINALAATTAGLASADEGGAISIRGSRDNATDYYIDGIRVSGALIPESEIDQLQVITGGLEAQYGDVTGGVISITTKGPSAKWSGGFEAESTEFFDEYDNRLIGANLSGPLLKNAKGESIIGLRLSGRYTYLRDDDPPATPVFRVTDDALARLEANPIVERTTASGATSRFVAADFTTAEDVQSLNARPFEENTRFDVTAKLDARLSKAIDISFTGAFRDQENFFSPGTTLPTGGRAWDVFNSHNNPVDLNRTWRGNFRFRHRLGGASAANEEDAKKGAVIQNASYIIQFGYENNTNNRYDTRHEENYFDYGYVGNFDVEWVPSFSFDQETGGFLHTDYRQVLRGYTPGDVNPVLANYNNIIDAATGADGGLNSSVPNYVSFFRGNSNISDPTSLADFIATNGLITSQFTNSWGFHTNVGTVYNQVNRADNDLITLNINSSFQIVPKGSSDKGRHNIQFGIWYEQRTNRTYRVFPRNLWNVARQQANSHILGIREGADSIGVFNLPNTIINGFFFPENEAAILDLSINEGADNRFYREVREITGQSLTDYVNIDGLDPSQLDLSLFSARELNDEGILNYFGYDYLGNEFNGTFEEFFSATDEDGVRTFPVAPNRPIYAAAYVQDKFTFRDIIFRVGLRVDRYDANTQVLKDNYSLYEIQGASDFHANNPDLARPGNIGDDYKVYTNDGGSRVTAYRDEDQWFFANGNPANSPIEIFQGGLVFPAYADARANSVANFIKSREFETSASFEDYEPQINFMPRLSFSFPISDFANFFAHYDILVQRPASNTFATARDYFYFTDVSGIRNNPNLRPTRTIDYEVGFQQRISNTSAIKISAYYRELRDMIQARLFFPVPLVSGNSYETYDNLDFGTVKGFSFNYDLRRTGNVQLFANYTLQFADGTGSDANTSRGLNSRGNIRNLIPLNYDERHRINLTLDYRYGSGKSYTGPTLFEKDFLADFGINLQAIAVSGRPYTATILPQKLGGTGFIGAINGARRPWNFTVNLRVDKTFQLAGSSSINAYVRVSNLLDRRNIIGLYSATGSAEDDGYLASTFGLNELNSIENSLRSVDSFLASYQWGLINPNLFSLPRRIYAGVIFGF